MFLRFQNSNYSSLSQPFTIKGRDVSETQKSRVEQWKCGKCENVQVWNKIQCVGWGGGGGLIKKQSVYIIALSRERSHCYLLRFLAKPVVHVLFILTNTSRNQAGFSKCIWWVQIFGEWLRQKWVLWVDSFKCVPCSTCLWWHTCFYHFNLPRVGEGPTSVHLWKRSQQHWELNKHRIVITVR